MPMVRTQAGWVSAGVNVRHNGAWRGAREVWVKENGEWKNALTYKARVWVPKKFLSPGVVPDGFEFISAPAGESHWPMVHSAYAGRNASLMSVWLHTYSFEMCDLWLPGIYRENTSVNISQYTWPGREWRNLAPLHSYRWEYGPVSYNFFHILHRHPIPPTEMAEITAYIQSCPGTHALFYFR